MKIETKDICIIPLEVEQLGLLCESQSKLEEKLNLTPSKVELDDYQREIYQGRYELCKEYPRDYLWYTNWHIILKSENKSIGCVSFCGPINDCHEVEVTYEIDKAYEKNDYLVKALKRLWQWVFSKKVYYIQTQTLPANQGLRALFVKSGFSRLRENKDYVLFELEKPPGGMYFISTSIFYLINAIACNIFKEFKFLGMAFLTETMILLIVSYLWYRKIYKNRIRK